MAMASGIGATVPGPAEGDPIPFFFGEDQGRYLVTVARPAGRRDRDTCGARRMGRHLRAVDRNHRRRRIETRRRVRYRVANLKVAHESWFPAFMNS
jgi:hypothetical protein